MPERNCDQCMRMKRFMVCTILGVKLNEGKGAKDMMQTLSLNEPLTWIAIVDSIH